MVHSLPGTRFTDTRFRGPRERRLGGDWARREIRPCRVSRRGGRGACSAAFPSCPANNRHVIATIVFMSVSFELYIVKLISIILRPGLLPRATTIPGCGRLHLEDMVNIVETLALHIDM